MAITAVMIPDTMTILTPIRPDPRPSIAGTASRDTNRTTRVWEPISDTMVNGIPARNKDPNKKAADLAAFFTTSLFSSDQHLHSNHQCQPVNHSDERSVNHRLLFPISSVTSAENIPRASDHFFMS